MGAKAKFSSRVYSSDREFGSYIFIRDRLSSFKLLIFPKIKADRTIDRRSLRSDDRSKNLFPFS